MSTALRLFVCLLVSLLATPAVTRAQAASADKLSGPYTHENLTIYLIHGPSTLKGEFLTLEEALAAKKVIVHETGNVNELAIENTGSVAVYLQSGDIVKGGKQDRCLGTDLTLAPKSGKVPIAAFCVEHGRWQQRGGEAAGLFSSSDSIVVGNAAKLAANANYEAGGGQQKVWDDVKSLQAKLSGTLKTDVSAATSPSSLQLSLEHPKVRATVEQYVDKLKGAIDEKAGGDKPIGYAVAVNGKVIGADVYGSSDLFARLWPKLLRSAATEAAAETPADAKQPPPAVSEGHVLDLIRDAETGKRSSKDLSGAAVTVTTSETKQNVMFESRQKNDDAYLHRSYLSK
jgi:hypothetical protein